MGDAAPETADALLGGRLSLVQGATGHRAGTDAVLLAAAAEVCDGDRFVDVGAGVGTAGLALALRCPGATGVLLEADAVAAQLARENCARNGVDSRVRVVEANLFDKPLLRAADLRFDNASLVVSNPPFYLPGNVRASPDPARASAHVLASKSHGDWARAMLALLAPKGRFVAIHRPEALPALLEGCAGRLGAMVVMPVLARRDGDAVRILLGGTKGSRAPLRIAPAFVLHEADGSFTPEAEAVHRGETVSALRSGRSGGRPP